MPNAALCNQRLCQCQRKARQKQQKQQHGTEKKSKKPVSGKQLFVVYDCSHMSGGGTSQVRENHKFDYARLQQYLLEQNVLCKDATSFEVKQASLISVVIACVCDCCCH